MIRTVSITALVTGLACFAVLLAQSGRYGELRERVANENDTITRLERGAPAQRSGPLTAIAVEAPAVGSTEAAVAQLRASTTPQERIDRTVSRIDLLLADVGDIERSPAALFKVLPDLLRLVQDLSLDEMIDVAEAIDAPLNMRQPDPKSVMKMILFMLAAEQDPARILQNTELMANREMRSSVLGSLARRDPAGARRWLEQSDIPEREKKQFEMLLTLRTLRDDPSAGLQMLREADDGGNKMLQGLANMPFPAKFSPELVAELDKPENADYRPHLVNLLISGAMFEGGVEAARFRVEELQLSDEDVAGYLAGASRQAIRTDARATIAWMSEALPEEKLLQSLPSAVQQWAQRDFNAAGEWLGEMEASPVKDATLASYAQTVAQVDAAAATAWAAEIQGEEQRMQALRQTVAHWRSQDREAADVWLRKQGIDPADITQESAPRETEIPSVVPKAAVEESPSAPQAE